jgi:predicted CoA-substrate-specific enzyme activase
MPDETHLPLRAGIDIGSKTVKVVLLDSDDKTVWFFYDHHLSNVKQTLLYALKRTRAHCKGRVLTVGVTGSAGIQFAELMGLPFVQEVLASKTALERFLPDTDVAIELGGEDSKILFLTGGTELRMNNTCAGGTGGFIDTIAGMFDLNAEEFNSLALGCSTVYPIASRCAVFAQSDVRPLLNEGISRYDIAGSVFAAVATQCVSGLACGRRIAGRVALLGGPFHFLSALRNAFGKVIGAQATVITPNEAHLFVAKGAALHAAHVNLAAVPGSANSRSTKDAASAASAATDAFLTIESLETRLADTPWGLDADDERLPTLFVDEADYAAFRARHDLARPAYGHLNGYEGRAYLGIDSGSTTIKCVLIGENNEFLFTYYERVAGDLIEAAEEMLRKLYKKLPRLHDGRQALTIAHTCVTGYGESFLLKAFQADSGEVETVAHLRAACHNVPDVDMVLDIGGQDIKYLTVRNGELSDIVLNEACSSGCGALIGGFAYSMNVKLPSFTEAALFAERPVDLGTRCTVFMTSRVRHAQKEGARTGEISAGLAYSVVRNALFKVIRLSDAAALGKHIVVQGGTFKSDAVLRAFEQISGREVYRSGAAEYMGAFGAALLAKERAQALLASGGNPRTGLLDLVALDRLRVRRQSTRCSLCSNRCMLTISKFYEEGEARPQNIQKRRNSFDAVVLGRDDGTSSLGHPEPGLMPPSVSKDAAAPRRLIVGNRCTRPLNAGLDQAKGLVNLYDHTAERLFALESLPADSAPRGSIGVLRALNAWDDYPLWHAFLTALGFNVVLSDPSDRNTYLRGVDVILSESACYPVKISNGHLLNLADKGLRTVFVPYVERGFADKLNCSVLAKNPLVFNLNIEPVYHGRIRLLTPHLDYADRESMIAELEKAFVDPFSLAHAEIATALDVGLAAYEAFWAEIRRAGRAAVEHIRASGEHGVVLAGRPYHLDSEMHHGLPEQLRSFGLSVLTVESVAHLAARPPKLYVDDRWEYPGRIYRAAAFVADEPCLDFIEMYSFGCGLDAVTCDQARELLEAKGRLFTSLKIDEMSDLAATRIRMRSMLAALGRDSR